MLSSTLTTGVTAWIAVESRSSSYGSYSIDGWWLDGGVDAGLGGMWLHLPKGPAPKEFFLPVKRFQPTHAFSHSLALIILHCRN